MHCEDVSCFVCGNDKSLVTATGYDYEYNTTDKKFYFVQCRNCGHEYLTPRPKPESVHKAYPDNYYTLAGRHSGNKSRLVPVLKKIVIGKRLSAFEAILKGRASVFEAGCGDCSLLIDLKMKNSDLDVSGIDLSFTPSTLASCERLGIKLIKGNVESVEFKEDTFELVIANQLIEHLGNPDAFIEKMSRALKENGCISLETPDREGYDRAFFKKSFWGGYYFPRHFHLFDFKSLESLIARHGLRVETHYSLVAPIIWAFSLHALFSHQMKPGLKKKCVAWVFSDRNPICLAVFTLADLLAKWLGLRTSNQKIIARKKS